MKVIPLIAILSTTHVSDGTDIRIYSGQDKAQFALEQCLKDPRDMNEMFELSVEDGIRGRYVFVCQMLETTTVPHYAVKGEYVEYEILPALLDAFKKQGIKVDMSSLNQTIQIGGS